MSSAATGDLPWYASRRGCGRGHLASPWTCCGSGCRACHRSEGVAGRISRSNLMIMIDRGDYFQIGVVIRKGSIATLRDQGIEMFRQRLRDAAPWLGDRVELLVSFDDIRLLNVVLSRLPRWYRDGLLCIGDAAHAMSPVGGVGINLAVQDAVAGGRILAASLRTGPVPTARLRAVQRRRWLPTVLTQAFQRLAHRVVVETSIADDEAAPRPTTAPAPLRLMQRFPVLQAIPGYLLGIGLLPSMHPISPALEPPHGCKQSGLISASVPTAADLLPGRWRAGKRSR